MPTGKRAPISEVAELLGDYVYILVDPRDGRPFYVGKGKGLRAQAHEQASLDFDARELAALAAKAETPEDPTGGADQDPEVRSEKLKRIRAIHDKGLVPEVWIARYGLTEKDYTQVEAALIDTLLSFDVVVDADRVPLGGAANGLTNKRREAARGHGMVKLQTLIDDCSAPDLESAEPLLLIRLNEWVDKVEDVPGGRNRDGYGFRDEWIDRSRIDLDELSLSTCSWWVLNPESVKRRGVTHAVAVFRGITRGLFEIDPDSWEEGPNGRRGFVGKPVASGPLWDAVVGDHGRRVTGLAKGSQNSIRYWPFV